MNTLSTQGAAAKVGVAKSSICRAIHAGKILAEKNEFGDWRIHPNELMRYRQRNGKRREVHRQQPSVTPKFLNARRGSKQADNDLGYGIIVYVPTPGCFPRDDEAHFEGWYSIRSWAEAVFEDFVRRYPNALVHLVARLKSDWRDGEVAE
jgi:hypothetical protein